MAGERTAARRTREQSVAGSGALRGPHAAERAALVLSLVAGFQMMRQMIGLAPLADADPKALARPLAPLFEQLVQKSR
jgi:tetracycline repressor-like protein